MKKENKLRFLGVVIVIVLCLASCGKIGITKIWDIQTNSPKYVGKKVTIEGFVLHNLFEIQEYEKRKRIISPVPPTYIRPEEYNYISDTNQGPLMSPMISAMSKFSGENIGIINVKYETQLPESGKMIRAKGIVKMKKVYGNLLPVLVVELWKYIQSPEEKTREKYKKHIIQE